MGFVQLGLCKAKGNEVLSVCVRLGLVGQRWASSPAPNPVANSKLCSWGKEHFSLLSGCTAPWEGEELSKREQGPGIDVQRERELVLCGQMGEMCPCEEACGPAVHPAGRSGGVLTLARPPGSESGPSHALHLLSCPLAVLPEAKWTLHEPFPRTLEDVKAPLPGPQVNPTDADVDSGELPLQLPGLSSGNAPSLLWCRCSGHSSAVPEQPAPPPVTLATCCDLREPSHGMAGSSPQAHHITASEM
ncbi:hypothetical protein CB1_000218017 [Camelus ferus]|nr:hypothetical protein CB1_000218017 [Camelus ferus]